MRQKLHRRKKQQLARFVLIAAAVLGIVLSLAVAVMNSGSGSNLGNAMCEYFYKEGACKFKSAQECADFVKKECYE